MPRLRIVRRVVVTGTVVLVLALGAMPAARVSAAPDLASLVSPFNGTQPGAPDFGTGGGAGNTFPGPVLPFGMMQWGPDTATTTQNAGGGYAYNDTKIRGFSLRRLSGAGCANGGDVPILPTPHAVLASPVKQFATNFSDDLLPAFAHNDEAASPGYYRVGLDPGTPARIDARLTATTRAGVARFSYPATRTASVLVNAAGSRTGNSAGDVHVDPGRHEITGSTSSGGFCLAANTYRVFFVARFNRAFNHFGTWTRQALAPGSTSAHDATLMTPASGSGRAPTAQTGGYVTFDTTADRVVELRVGMSFVSVDNARHNLDAETAGADLSTLRARARAAWNHALGRIDVQGGLDADRRTFYSMLYHALVAPSTFSDVDGRYAGMDGEVHTARGYTQYADFSGWDVYRSQVPLLALVAPRQASDLVTSLLADQRQSGWLPKWSTANGHTEVMTGDPADPTIAAIWALGDHHFDVHDALAAVVKGATQIGKSRNAGYVEREALEDYVRLGYVPHEKNANAVGVLAVGYLRSLPAPHVAAADLPWGSVATTLEYATADFAVARLGAAAGEPAVCRTFIKRAANWRNVFDPSTGYVRPRSMTGAFVEPYDPNYNDSLSSQGFAEGDGAQYTWMVPHDPAGLFQALGGRDHAKARLDLFFQELNAGFSSSHAFLGNEPNSNAPWLYDWIGEPSKVQDIVRRAILGLFNATPGGYPGNDDLGQMSAWYVFGALGFYPAVPGTGVLALGSPLFPKATLHLTGGDVVINAPHASRGARYVRGVTLNGAVHSQPWLPLSAIAHGAALDFDLTGHPDRRWGSTPAAAPPSFGPADREACRPQPGLS